MLMIVATAAADEVREIAWSPAGDEVMARVYVEAKGESATLLLRRNARTPVSIAIPGPDAGFAWVTPNRVLLSGDMGTTLNDLVERTVTPMLDRSYPVVDLSPDHTVLATWNSKLGGQLWVAEPCKPKLGETTCVPRRWIPRPDTPKLAGPVIWLADGGFLVAGSTPDATTLTRYNAAASPMASVPLPPGPVRVDAAEDGRFVVWQDARVSAWVMEGRIAGSGLSEPTAISGAPPASAVDLSASGEALVIGTTSGEVWALRNDSTEWRVWSAGHVRVRAVAVSPDGTAVCADADGEISFWTP